MSPHGFLSSLNLMTLVVVLVIVVFSYAYFMRKRSHRKPMEGRQERNIAKDIDAGRPPPDRSPRE